MMYKSRKIIFLTILSTVVLLAAVWFGGEQGMRNPVQAAGDEISEKNIISVMGQGEVDVDPDVAYTSLGVYTEGKDANEAQTKNANAFKVLEKELLGTFGIDKKNIKTTSFNVNPKYQYQDKEEPKIIGYTATHMIQITYRDLNKIGALLDAASKAGANQISHIQFSIEKMEEYHLQALEIAMANAKGKAGVIAKSMDKALKAPVSVTENGFGGANPIYWEGAKAQFSTEDSAAGTPISSGQIKVSAQVNVKYGF